MQFIKKNKYLFLTTVLTFLISLLFVYSGDDWQWAQTPLTFQSFASPYLNGRYVGNFIVILLCKNIIIRGLIITTILNSLVFLISKITKVNFLLIWFFLILMPLDIFKESIVWASGFANYVTSTLMLIICLIFLKKSYLNELKKPINLFLLLLIFIISSLIIENLTVYLVFITLALNIIYFFKNKKINVFLISSLLGSLIGAIIMFTHPAYYFVATQGDGYRTLSFNLSNMFKIFLNNSLNVITKYLALDNLALIIIISTILYIIYSKQHKKQWLPNLLFIYQALYIGYALIHALNPNWQVLLSYTNLFNTLISYLYLITIIILLIVLRQSLKINFYFILTITSLFGLILPLFIVSPIGARNFFMMYILEIMLICFLLSQLNYSKYPIITHLSFIIGLVIIGYYINIYGYITYINLKRETYIIDKSQNTNQTTILAPYLPYSDYVHVPDFESDYYQGLYYSLKHLRPNLKIRFTSYQEWKQIK